MGEIEPFMVDRPPTMRPERKRPLRTYSRRTQPEAEPDGPSKRRKIEELGSEAASLRAASGQPQLPELPQPEEPVKRGTILAFFKPLNSSSSAVSSHVTSDPTDHISSPPSSPPVLPKARKRRRLTTRPGVESDDISEGPGFMRDDRERAKEDASDQNRGDAQDEALLTMTNRAGHDKDDIMVGEATAKPMKEGRRALQEIKTGSSTGNATLADAKDGVDVMQRRSRWRANQAKVQTVLSLSINDPGFKICGECEMLYNPLNEKDRKDHARQHAAAARRKRELQGDMLDDN